MQADDIPPGPAHADTEPAMRHAPAACGIAIMAKASRPGLTKTRLVPPLSFEEAALLNTAFLKDVAETLRFACKSSDIAGYVGYGPANSNAYFCRHLPPRIMPFECWTGDLTGDVVAAMSRLFENGHAAACVMNSDSPTLPPDILVQAARELETKSNRIVLGPSSDGGFYFLGARGLYPALFEGIAWSTDGVAAHVTAQAEKHGLQIYELPLWYDVDDANALQRLMDDLQSPSLASNANGAAVGEHTRQLLQKWTHETDFAARLETVITPFRSR